MNATDDLHPFSGPLLFLRGMDGDQLLVTVLVIGPEGDAAPVVRSGDGDIPGEAIWHCEGRRVLQFAFSLGMAQDAWYSVDGRRYEVNADLTGDLRIAYVSCNGQEEGDRRRSLTERNVLWRRLKQQHGKAPFQLLLHGGDQIYADELLDAHPRLRQWAKSLRGENDTRTADELEAVADALRRGFFRRYLELLSQPEMAWLMARIPSLAMWDDHDICDGWGSMRAAQLDTRVGQCLFEVAREHFLLFQMGVDPARRSGNFLDSSGESLSWLVRLPQLHVIAPDLRSERRPDRVMGPHGWASLETALGAVEEGRVLLLSSVPALGPRLSWVEAVMHLTWRMEKYEDDLRDQWQSRAHRAEWRKFLWRLAEVHADPATPVTLLSGEIHLATRGTLDVPPAPLHQLVASGITHPAPPLIYARTLGTLARLGESPLPEHPIRLRPLPGKVAIYTAQRNYLILERRGTQWQAWWELEEGGATLPLAL